MGPDAYGVPGVTTETASLQPGRIRDTSLVAQTRFACVSELEATLHDYLIADNHLPPQKALNFLSPIDEMKLW